MIVIRACKSNESVKNEKLLREIISPYDQVKLVIEDCLNRCSFCEKTPYVMINNHIEFGDDVEELLENIKEEVERLKNK